MWFDNNYMKANPEKSCLLLSSKTPEKAYFDGDLIESCSIEKLFRVKSGSVLAFDEHIFSMCKKVGKKKQCS